MGKGRELENKKVRHPEEKVFWVISIALVGLIAPALFFYEEFNNLPPGGPTDWAAFGSFYSGIATPVIAFCSALIFFRSIVIQRDEFDKTRREMRQATQIQLGAETRRQQLFLQERLERTIPKARQLQSNCYDEFTIIVDLKRGRQDDVIGEFATKFDKNLDEIAREDNSLDVLTLLSPYFLKSRHLADMLIRYINAGGDVYFHLDITDAVQSEFEYVREVIDAYGLTSHEDYIEYAESMNCLRSDINKTMQYYTEGLYTTHS